MKVENRDDSVATNCAQLEATTMEDLELSFLLRMLMNFYFCRKLK